MIKWLSILLTLVNCAKINGSAGKNNSSYSSLYLAVRDGNAREVQEILASDASGINEKDASWETPLHTAARTGQLAIVKVLVEAKADLESRQSTGYTPLISAAWKNQTEVLQYLLSVGANVDAVSKYGDSAYTFAGNSLVKIMQMSESIAKYRTAQTEQQLQQEPS
jgi:ankyrin repeat protein